MSEQRRHSYSSIRVRFLTAMVGAMTIKTLVDHIFEGLRSVIQPPLTEEQTDTE